MKIELEISHLSRNAPKKTILISLAGTEVPMNAQVEVPMEEAPNLFINKKFVLTDKL